MLRFILIRSRFDTTSEMRELSHETLDVDVPVLEERLSRGGYGETGHDTTSLNGIEILHPAPAKTEER